MRVTEGIGRSGDFGDLDRGLRLLELSLGAGAIFQVIYEVGKLLLKDYAREQGEKKPSLSASLSVPNLAGLTVGVAIMW